MSDTPGLLKTEETNFGGAKSGSSSAAAPEGSDAQIPGIHFVDYKDESQLDYVMELVGRDLSEPYSIFTYRYFLYRFPQLCILAVDDETNEYIGVVVGKMDVEDDGTGAGGDLIPLDPIAALNNPDGQQQQQQHAAETGNDNDDQQQQALQDGLLELAADAADGPTTSGYIGMLAVNQAFRRRGIGQALVQRILRRMKAMGCSSATLETEVTNTTAQKLYQEQFGFIREELLVRYYLNWNDAYRLRLWF